MILPSKHLNLNTCVLRAASILLLKLQATRVCSYANLRACLDVFGENADIAFGHSLHLLFLLGRIEYRPQTDSIEYIQPESVS